MRGALNTDICHLQIIHNWPEKSNQLLFDSTLGLEESPFCIIHLQSSMNMTISEFNLGILRPHYPHFLKTLCGKTEKKLDQET